MISVSFYSYIILILRLCQCFVIVHVHNDFLFALKISVGPQIKSNW